MLLSNLPKDMLYIIYTYLSNDKKIFLNKCYYKMYHYLLRYRLTNYRQYIKNIINSNNLFVFTQLLDENYYYWVKLSKIVYKNIIYSNYISYILGLALELNNNNIRALIIQYYNDKGLSKNLHKKKYYNNNKWIQ